MRQGLVSDREEGDHTDVTGFGPLALFHLHCVDFGLGPLPTVLFFLSLQEGL